MTYRTMHGLGATPPPPTLSDASLALFLKGYLATGGCATPAVKANFDALSCLNNQLVQIGGACYLGRTPTGLTDLEFASACMDLAKCGVFTKPGCPADSAPYLSSVPKCLNADVGPLVDYCRQYPQFNGDNKQANAACWAMSRYQDVYQKVMALGPCPSPSVTVAPPVYQPAPPPPSAAPPAYQPPPPSDMPPPQQSSAPPGSPEATPGPIDVAPPDSGSSVTTDAGAPPPAPQKSNMMMWGLAGAAALGVGYLIFRKK